jgi:Ca-activated chloride channel family protein
MERLRQVVASGWIWAQGGLSQHHITGLPYFTVIGAEHTAQKGNVMSSSQPTNGAEHNLSFTTAWERAAVPASGGEAYLLIRIAANESSNQTRRAPVDVAFVVDRSGSMSGDKLQLAKEAVDAAIRHLTDDDRAALVVFDNEIDTLHALESATPRVKSAIRLTLNGVDARGGTFLSGGWLSGCNELSRDMPAPQLLANAPIRIRRSLLLTDGQANVGITNPGELCEHASELRKRGVSTSALGIGEGFDELLLESMAEAGGGNFQYIAGASQLREFFERELGDLLEIAAAGMTISLTLPHGVRAQLLNFFPAQRIGKRIDVSIGELSANDEINLVFALQVAPGKVGTSHQISVEATWADPIADARRSVAMFLPALLVDEPNKVEQAPVDETVREQVAKKRAASDQREAVRLDRAGRYVESRAKLLAADAYLAAAPPSAEISHLRMEFKNMAEYDASIAYDEATRKQAIHDAHHRSRRQKRDR